MITSRLNCRRIFGHNAAAILALGQLAGYWEQSVIIINGLSERLKTVNTE